MLMKDLEGMHTTKDLLRIKRAVIQFDLALGIKSRFYKISLQE